MFKAAIFSVAIFQPIGFNAFERRKQNVYWGNEKKWLILSSKIKWCAGMHQFVFLFYYKCTAQYPNDAIL